ncbi:MAG: hypothetical protein ABS36_03115 [Acidobacteria bacterium SCN 69-37]|nr:MAG: hypothetical protein ABS36_03115 [Acidobacteria bacterium SCN 69-37]
MSIHVGTSGWHYPGGRGTWNGVFYPARRPRGFDELTYYAAHFDSVEVNTTFYRQPDPAHAAAWLQRTPPAFTFAVKLYQKFTHPAMYVEKHGTAEWDVTRGDLDVFRLGIAPLANAGRLLALLLQFPPSFRAETVTRDYLAWLLDALREYPLAVELRHRSWSDDEAATRAVLDHHRAAWVLIDEPKFHGSIRQDLHGPTTRLVDALLPAHARPASSICYIRLHGRNAAQWWSHAQAEDRYDYLYAATELAPFAEAAREAEADGRKVAMYLNNHFSSKAVANAAILRHQLAQDVPGEYPREMVDRYPELAGIVSTAGLPL